MSKYDYFIGIDVSKEKLDVAVCQGSELKGTSEVENNFAALRKWLKSLCSQYQGLSAGNSIFCLENTGKYMNHIVEALVLSGYGVWIENALSIKRSMGLVRGKDDRIDAVRIAQYSYRFQDRIRLHQVSNGVLQELKALETTREKLKKMKHGIEVELQEAKRFESKNIYEIKRKFTRKTLDSIKKELAQLDKAMLETIRKDDGLKGMYKIITSIPGVGMVTATAVLVATQGFTLFENAKQFACYAGVAPFPRRSGSSIRGKNQVSPMANKHIKSLIHMCAKSSVAMESEFRVYYQKKVDEGKNKMAVFNAIRNKIILRMFALIRDGREYEKNHSYSLA